MLYHSHKFADFWYQFASINTFCWDNSLNETIVLNVIDCRTGRPVDTLHVSLFAVLTCILLTAQTL